MSNIEISIATQTLKNAKSILLIDWPNMDVPRRLLNAGFTVYSYSPGQYSNAQLKGENDVVFNNIDGSPGEVDIVNVFRPEQEHQEIINTHVFPLRAKVIWLHPPVTSAWAADFASQNKLTFIEGIDIAGVAVQLKTDKL